MLGNKLLNIRFAKYHIWNNKSEGFPNMVLSTETFNQSVCTEYSEAVNARYTFQPLWVSDLMSLDSNCQRDAYGNLLPHYTPWATPGSAGINVFANPLPAARNIYVFPPFVSDIIVPDIRLRPFWWATIQAFSVDRFLLGRKGSGSILLFPSQHSQEWLARPLQWDSGRSDVSASKYFCLTVPLIPRF